MKGVKGSSHSVILGKRTRGKTQDKGKTPAKYRKVIPPRCPVSSSSSESSSLSERSTPVSSGSSVSLSGSVSSSSEVTDDDSLSDDEVFEPDIDLRQMYSAVTYRQSRDAASQIEQVCSGLQRAGLLPKENLSRSQLNKLKRDRGIELEEVAIPGGEKLVLFYREECAAAEKAASVYKQRIAAAHKIPRPGKGDKRSRTIYESRINLLLLDAQKELINGGKSFDRELKTCRDDFIVSNLSWIIGLDVSSVKKARKNLVDKGRRRIPERFLNFIGYQQLITQLEVSLNAEGWCRDQE